MQKKRESSKRIFSLFGFFGIFAKYFCMEINKKTYKSLRFIFFNNERNLTSDFLPDIGSMA